MFSYLVLISPMVPTQVRSVVEVDTLKTNLIYSYTTGINNKLVKTPTVDFRCVVYRFPCLGKFIKFFQYSRKKHGELERLNVAEEIFLTPSSLSCLMIKKVLVFSLYLVELMNDLNYNYF